VPRILTREALLLYRRSEAFFIGCGASTHPIAGGLYFRDCLKIVNPKLLKAITKNRMLIVYCA